MLYEAIRLGCKLYHRNELSYNEAYGDYLKSRDAANWDSPERLDTAEVKKLIDFANRWRCRMPSGPRNTELLLGGLQRATPALNLLRHNTILDIRFDNRVLGTTVSKLISDSFDQIRCAGRRFERVATSKMVHAAINPHLFVPWDGDIISAYGCEPGHGREYAETFLPKMQRTAERAIGEVMTTEGRSRDDAIASLTPCQESLAKVLDEFNWVKFRLGDDRVRQVEQEPVPLSDL